MIGPNSSGRMAASIMTAHPPWQLPTTQAALGFDGRRMQGNHPFKENRFRPHNIPDGLPRHRVRQEALRRSRCQP